MGDYLDEPVIPFDEFEPGEDVYNIWPSKKFRMGTKNGETVRIDYWLAVWQLPREFWPEDAKPGARPYISASSPVSKEEAIAKCQVKIKKFWAEIAESSRSEKPIKKTKRQTLEERKASYTVKSFLEEWFASKTNPNTAAENRLRDSTARLYTRRLNKWIYPELGDTPLNELTHRQVRYHFTEYLPSVLDKDDNRVLNDQTIRGVYSTFRAGITRAHKKELVALGEFDDIGLKASFDPAGIDEHVENLMWEMNSLLQKPEVIEDPLALRWALAYGMGLRRGERCGLKWSDIDFEENVMTISRQLTYTTGVGDWLDERLKSGEKRTIVITPITRPFLLKAFERRKLERKAADWRPREGFEDLVLLRPNGSCENVNHDNALYHEFMEKYQVPYNSLAPGALRHAAATYWACYGGEDGRGVPRAKLRQFLGHSPDSKLDAYYARTSQEDLGREFSSEPIERPTKQKKTPINMWD